MFEKTKNHQKDFCHTATNKIILGFTYLNSNFKNQ